MPKKTDTPVNLRAMPKVNLWATPKPVFQAGEDEIAWRHECFTKLGFDELTAAKLTLDNGVELSHVRYLISEGCSLKLAAEIVL